MRRGGLEKPPPLFWKPWVTHRIRRSGKVIGLQGACLAVWAWVISQALAPAIKVVKQQKGMRGSWSLHLPETRGRPTGGVGGSGKGHRTYRKLDGKAHDGFASLSYFLFSSVGGALDTILKLLGAFILQTQIKYKAISTSIIRKQWPSFSWLSIELSPVGLVSVDLT